jgi:hypothetical protein
MFASDTDSDRASSIEDYQNTCTEFINDISRDYKDWVDRYQLSQEETKTRKAAIDNIVRTTNEWIIKYGNTIKKVDIIMVSAKWQRILQVILSILKYMLTI